MADKGWGSTRCEEAPLRAGKHGRACAHGCQRCSTRTALSALNTRSAAQPPSPASRFHVPLRADAAVAAAPAAVRIKREDGGEAEPSAPPQGATQAAAGASGRHVDGDGRAVGEEAEGEAEIKGATVFSAWRLASGPLSASPPRASQIAYLPDQAACVHAAALPVRLHPCKVQVLPQVLPGQPWQARRMRPGPAPFLRVPLIVRAHAGFSTHTHSHAPSPPPRHPGQGRTKVSAWAPHWLAWRSCSQWAPPWPPPTSRPRCVRQVAPLLAPTACLLCVLGWAVQPLQPAARCMRRGCAAVCCLQHICRQHGHRQVACSYHIIRPGGPPLVARHPWQRSATGQSLCSKRQPAVPLAPGGLTGRPLPAVL